MTTDTDEQEDKPLDPAVERVRRKLVRFVVINLAILFVALMAVVGALVYRMVDDGGRSAPAATLAVPADGQPIEARIPLPGGAQVLHHAMSGDRLSLAVQLPDGRRQIVVYDMAAQQVVGRFALTD